MKQSDMRKVLVIQPDPTHPRHSEGCFIRLNDGGILFAYSRFNGDWLDDAPSDIVGRVSYDEGETWSEPHMLIKASDHNGINVMSCTMMRMQDGELGLFYIIKTNAYTFQIWLSRSKDEGKTFYRHIQCSAHRGDGIYVMNNDRVRRLDSGRIIIPIAIHRIERLEGGKRMYDFRATTMFLLSDDDGETFRESFDILFMPSQRSKSGLQEPGVVEVRPGLLWAYMRTDMMFQWETFSFDGGDRWTQPQPSRFTSPNSPMLVVKNPANGELISIFNPIPEYLGRNAPRESGGRTPLVYTASSDMGDTWSEEYVIEDNPRAGYCYPSCFFTNDGHMLLSYCSGLPEQRSCLSQTTLTKVKL